QSAVVRTGRDQGRFRRTAGPGRSGTADGRRRGATRSRWMKLSSLGRERKRFTGGILRDVSIRGSGARRSGARRSGATRRSGTTRRSGAIRRSGTARRSGRRGATLWRVARDGGITAAGARRTAGRRSRGNARVGTRATFGGGPATTRRAPPRGVAGT